MRSVSWATNKPNHDTNPSSPGCRSAIYLPMKGGPTRIAQQSCESKVDIVGENIDGDSDKVKTAPS